MNGLRVIFQREINAYLRSSVGYIVAATVLMLDGLLFYTQALGPDAEARVSGQVRHGGGGPRRHPEDVSVVAFFPPVERAPVH